MRIAVVSDIHANLTALDAVIADVRKAAVDLVVHAGDLVGGGPRPAEVIDRIREMNWPGVFGNTDEVTCNPEVLSEKLPGRRFQRLRDAMLGYTIPHTLRAIGAERLAWLRMLPARWSAHDLTVVHAGPTDAWQVVPAHAADDDLVRVFGGIGTSRLVYGHIHVPFVRRLPTMTVANSGAVSLSFDHDPRASYAIVDDKDIEIRRVAYDIEQEIEIIGHTNDPFRESTVTALRTGRYVP